MNSHDSSSSLKGPEDIINNIALSIKSVSDQFASDSETACRVADEVEITRQETSCSSFTSDSRDPSFLSIQESQCNDGPSGLLGTSQQTAEKKSTEYISLPDQVKLLDHRRPGRPIGSRNISQDLGPSLTDSVRSTGTRRPLRLRKERGQQHFINPGKFMENFIPEKSSREMKKLARQIVQNSIKNQMYDETGQLLENHADICDCLDIDCPGCHFPCRHCESEKCGVECRINRRWLYDSVVVEGTSISFQWPYR